MGFGPSQGAGSSSGFANPMTTSGDTIYGGTGGTATRLAKGSDGTYLKLASGVPSWAAVTGGSGTIIFANRADVSVSNTTEVTICSATYTGSLAIAAGGFTAGKTFRVRIGGIMNLVSGHSATVYLYIGSTVIGQINTGGLGGTDITGGQAFSIEIDVTTRTADSTTYSFGSWMIQSRTMATGANIEDGGNESTDKSAGGNLNVTWDFSHTAAGDTCTVKYLTIEAL